MDYKKGGKENPLSIVIRDDYLHSEMNQFQHAAEERLGVYQFLSTVFCQALSLEIVERLLSKDQEETIAQQLLPKTDLHKVNEGICLIKAFIQNARNKKPEEVQTLLAVEYTKLVRGLRPGYGPHPPYESVYRSSSGNPSPVVLREVHSLYARLGVSTQTHEQPDFIGLELDLMRYLLEKEIAAWKNGCVKKAVEILKHQWDLLNDHMNLWFPAYCQDMYDHAKLDFYKGIALITMDYPAQDLIQLKEILETAQSYFC